MCAQIAGIQDFRQEGPPGDTGVFQGVASIIIYQFTFSGVIYTVAQRMGIRGWSLVGSGTNATVLINSVLGGVVPYSVIVFYRTQQFTISAALLVTVEGTIIDGLNFVLANASNCDGILIKAHKVFVGNCVADGNKVGQGVANKCGIYIDTTVNGAEDVTIEKCISHDWKDIGIRVDGNNSFVTGCTSYSNARDGIAGDIGTGIILMGNTCHDNINLEIGVGLVCINFVIANNLCIGGTSIWGSIFVGGDSIKGVVIGNVINGNGTAQVGIGIGTQMEAYEILVSGNRITGTVVDAIRVDRPNTRDIEIIGNHISDCVQGITVITTVNNIKIEENYLHNLSGTPITSRGKGTVIGNTIDLTTATGGIVVVSTTSMTVANNYLKDIYSYGIELVGTQSIIRNNVIVNANTHGFANHMGCGIWVNTATYNDISGNFIISGTGALIYQGIREYDASCDYNHIHQNTIINVTAEKVKFFGTNTTFESVLFQFTQGGDVTGSILAQFISAAGSAKGWEIDAAAEWTIALGTLPPEIQQIMRIKIWAVGLAAPAAGNQMRADFTINAGQPDEVYTGEVIVVASKESDQTAFAVNDVISWTLTAADDADIGHLIGGDCLEARVDYRAAVAPDIETDAVFRCIEIQYV